MSKKQVGPTLEMISLSSIIVETGFNPRFDYGEIAEMTAHYEANGVKLMQPLLVRPALDEMGKIAQGKYRIIDGHRRFAALSGMSVQPELIPVIVRTDNDKQALASTILLNGGKHLSPWEQAEVVSRFLNLNYSQGKIAKETGISPARVSRLVILTELPEWVWDCGLQGKIQASLVWSLYDDCKGNIEVLTQKLTEKKGEIELSGVTAKAFDFTPKALTPEQIKEVETAKAKAVETALVNEANKRFSSAVKKAESLKVDIKSVPSPSDETNPVFQGKSAVERYDYCTDLVNQAIATKESADKQAREKEELDKQEAARKLVEESKQVAPSGDSPAQSSPNAKPGEVPGNSVIVGSNTPVAPVAPVAPEAPAPREGNERDEVKSGNLHARVNIFVNEILTKVQSLHNTKARNETVRLSMILTGLGELEKQIGAFKSKEDLV